MSRIEQDKTDFSLAYLIPELAFLLSLWILIFSRITFIDIDFWRKKVLIYRYIEHPKFYSLPWRKLVLRNFFLAEATAYIWLKMQPLYNQALRKSPSAKTYQDWNWSELQTLNLKFRQYLFDWKSADICQLSAVTTQLWWVNCVIKVLWHFWVKISVSTKLWMKFMRPHSPPPSQ